MRESRRLTFSFCIREILSASLEETAFLTPAGWLVLPSGVLYLLDDGVDVEKPSILLGSDNKTGQVLSSKVYKSEYHIIHFLNMWKYILNIWYILNHIRLHKTLSYRLYSLYFLFYWY